MEREDIEAMVDQLIDYWPEEKKYFEEARDFVFNNNEGFFARLEIYEHLKMKMNWMMKEITGEYNYENY